VLFLFFFCDDHIFGGEDEVAGLETPLKDDDHQLELW